MSLFRSDFHRLSLMGLSWGFRRSMMTNDGGTVYADLTDRNTRLVVATAEGHNQEDALSKAVELAVRADEERRLAAAERPVLKAENERLRHELSQIGASA